MATPTMGYMVPVEVHERQKAINRDLAAGFSFDEASRRNDPNHVPYPKTVGGPRPVTDYGPMSPAYIDAPTVDVESAPEPAWVTEHKKRSAQFDSPGMSLADLFDNRLWETYEAEAAPKRGGTVERRRYIGKNPMTMEFTGVDYGPTRQSGANQPVDDLAERFRNRDTRGPVTLFPVDSLDKQDMLDVAGRDYGIHGNETPYYDQEPPVQEPSMWDQAGEFGTSAWEAAKNFGAPAWEKVGRGWDWANQPLAQPTTWSEQAQEDIAARRPVTPSREVGTADRMILNGILDNISNPFVLSKTAEEFAGPRARYKELVAEGVDKSTAAITAAREFGYPTGETRDERRREREAEKIKTLQFLKDSGQLQTAPNGTEYITIG